MTNFLNYQEFKKNNKLISNIISGTKDRDGILSKTFFKEFKYDRMLTKGVQGFILKFDTEIKQEVKNSDTKKEKIPVIMKISNSLDFSILHEYLVTKSLNDLREFCPHFVSVYNATRIAVSDRYTDTKDPDFNDIFNIRKDPLHIYALISEYIPDAETFTNFITDSEPKEIYSALISILCGIRTAQKVKKFTHYDLHVDNVLVTPIPSNTVFVYIIDDRVIWTPTYGNLPIIIDFGFAYTSDLLEKKFNCILQHTDVGYIPLLYDSFADTKVFLNSLASELNDQDSKKYSYFVKLIRKLYENLNIDRETGWDESQDISMTEYIANIIDTDEDKDNCKCPLFKNYTLYITEIINGLITLPLKDYGDSDVKEPITVLINQFSKIIRGIQDDYIQLYLFYSLVDIGRKHKKDVKQFMRAYIEEVISSVPLHKISSDVDFSTILNCLNSISERLSTGYIKLLSDIKNQKVKEYRKLPLKKVVDIITLILVNFTPSYQFNEKTAIYYWDVDKQCGNIVKKLTRDDVKELNTISYGKIGKKLIKLKDK